MRSSWLLAAFSALPVLAAVASAPASAQSTQGNGVDPQRNCQTIRSCRFERGGSFRGCLSSYTCRTCRPVTARCEIGGRSQNCQRMICTWGG
jgi:hypothetical protein